ncbi:MAG: immune inhibitor A [Elusimicrobia bacterium]|nr:immune inhibitor A [Elusimicrobiota bacterium]
MVQSLAELRFDRLAPPQIKIDSIPPVLSPPERPHRLLVIPVRFTDVGFDRFKGDPSQDEKNRRYLQELLFSKDLRRPRPKTLTHYYYHQSKGRYFVTGDVFPVVRVDKPLAYYGIPRQGSDGEWRNDSEAEALVVDALEAAYKSKPSFPWADYDVWDPQDFDGDGRHDEADGYIDHFILVYAGKGQSSCDGLYKLNEKLTANAPADILEKLRPEERACAQRLWPHRYSLGLNNGRGPAIEGLTNGLGGVPVRRDLWVRDYNMQPEYTTISTFIHEFAHSLGLPDIYARQTNNSTASWDAMSSTEDPDPQELSSWSRLMLGWLKPCVIKPRSYGGKKVQSVYLKTMNDWSPSAEAPAGLCDAAMAILPPKFKDLNLAEFGARQGRQAVYTGQGNEMNHFLSRAVDLTRVDKERIVLDFDAWFSIEADWDYLYVEASTDGVHYARLMPTDKDSEEDPQSVMPSKRGHDGAGTVPGFTGRSGDMDGDGKVESAPGCDPKKDKKLAEDRMGGQKDPCETPQWVHARFDLSAYRGRKIELRFHYFTDMASVEDGALIDNVEITALGFKEDFEGPELAGWDVEGFSLSGGKHRLAMPHYYLLEYRDPYEKFPSAYNYDRSLSEGSLTFYPDGEKGFAAMNARYRPGVVMWYYNGAYSWSENEPAQNGPGQGYLLVVDSRPQEYRYPPVPAKYFKTSGGWTYHEFDDEAKPWLRESFLQVMCFQRKPSYYPGDISDEDRAACPKGGPALNRLSFKGRRLIFGYELVNEHLPGPDWERLKGAGSLFDIRVRQGEVSYRLNDRRLRDYHSADAPFALEAFPAGLEFYRVGENGLSRRSSQDFPPVSRFDDSEPAYLNPKLPFGGAALPNSGLRFSLAKPKPQAPSGAKVKVNFEWSR